MQDFLPWMAPWSAWGLYLFLLALGLVLVCRGLFTRPRLDRPQCPKCRYDRTGLPGAVCPECGHTLRRAEDAFRGRPRRWLVPLGLAIAFTLPTFAVQRRVQAYGWEYYLRVGPLYWLVAPEALVSEDVAGYRIEVLYDRRRISYDGARFTGSILRVRRGGTVYFENKEWIQGVLDVVPLGTDLNGNGVPDVLLKSGDTGTSSITTAWLLELGPRDVTLLGKWRGFEGGLLDVEGPAADGSYALTAYEWDGWDKTAIPLTWDGHSYVPADPPTASQWDDIPEDPAN